MFIIIQNDPKVPVGAFGGYLAEEGVPCRLVRPYLGESLPALATVAAVIILGGAMGVHDTDRHPFLVALQEFMQQCVVDTIPLLGICLGGQLLAEALGGRVTTGSCGEKGLQAVRLSTAGAADPLFAGIGEEFTMFQWHNDCFALPEGAVLLASSAVCPGQAFRYGENAYGLQFHPEVDRSIIDLWARKTEHTAAKAVRVLADFSAGEDAYRGTSRRLLGNFLRIAGL
jgi:GMP synthase (glutamine-hydrolysing)